MVASHLQAHERPQPTGPCSCLTRLSWTLSQLVFHRWKNPLSSTSKHPHSGALITIYSHALLCASGARNALGNRVEVCDSMPHPRFPSARLGKGWPSQSREITTRGGKQPPPFHLQPHTASTRGPWSSRVPSPGHGGNRWSRTERKVSKGPTVT